MKLEFANTLFPNWVKIRQKRKRTKVAQNFIRINIFAEILNQHFTPKMGHFDFFQLIKSYAETNLLIDEEYVSQEAFYTAQQSSRRVKSPKI